MSTHTCINYRLETDQLADVLNTDNKIPGLSHADVGRDTVTLYVLREEFSEETLDEVREVCRAFGYYKVVVEQ